MMLFFFHYQVNETSLEDVTHEEAVAALKKTQDRVVIVVSRIGVSYIETPPPRYQDVLKTSKWIKTGIQLSQLYRQYKKNR